MFTYGTKTFVAALFVIDPNLEITEIPIDGRMNK